MLKEPKRFSLKHWWNLATLILVAAGLALWIVRLIDGRIVLAGLFAWVLLGLLVAPALMYEHLGFLDRWIFHDYVKAHRRYRKAVDTGKATPQGQCALASLAYAEGDFAEAARLLEEASDRLPEDAHLSYLLSRALSKLGRHEEAAAEAVRAAKLQGKSVIGEIALGDALLARGDTLSAASAYQKAVAEKPSLTHGHLGLAICYLSLGHIEAARDEIGKTLRLEPRNPDVLFWAGKVASAQNSRQDALRLLQESLAARPIADEARLVPYRDVIVSLCDTRENLPPSAALPGSVPGTHLDRM